MEEAPKPGGTIIRINAVNVALIGLMITVTGGFIKDRSDIQQSIQIHTTRIEQMQKDVDDYRNKYVTRAEYELYTRGLDQRLSDLQSDIKDIKNFILKEK